MAAVAELSVLLLALISNIHAEELVVIRKESLSYTFELPEEAGSCLISRFVGEEKLVLWNTSDLWPQNSSVPEDLKQRLVRMADNSSYKINDLTRSDSGLYQEECWTEGNVTHERNITVIVCFLIAPFENGQMEDDDLLCSEEAESLDVQWLKRDHRYEQEIWTRVVGASVMDNDRGRYQVVKNTSALRISNFSTADLGVYTCLEMDQQQCFSSHPVEYQLEADVMYHSVNDTVVLQCSLTDFSEETPPYWTASLINSDQGKLNYSSLVDQNYSLVLTSVTLNHSGLYSCNTLTTVKLYELLVCPKFPRPAVELFSGGEEVTLRCKDWENGRLHTWFFKSNRTKGRTLTQYDQISINARQYPDGRLVISDVSLQDTGEYWCGVRDQNGQCMFSTKTLLMHRDPFGVYSTFYAVRCSALSVLLLVLCVAVVTVTLRTRGEDT